MLNQLSSNFILVSVITDQSYTSPVSSDDLLVLTSSPSLSGVPEIDSSDLPLASLSIGLEMDRSYLPGGFNALL